MDGYITTRETGNVRVTKPDQSTVTLSLNDAIETCLPVGCWGHYKECLFPDYEIPNNTRTSARINNHLFEFIFSDGGKS